MKIIKYLFFLLLIAIIAGAIYVATKDGDYHFEESAIVNAPLPVVYNEVNNYNNWENWGPWRTATNDMIVEYNPQSHGEGAGFSWKSDDLGDGTIITTNVVPDSIINQKLVHSPTSAQSQGDMYWRFEEVEEGTLVTVGVAGSQSFREKLAFTFNDRSVSEIMRPRLQTSLTEMERAVQEKMGRYAINVDGVTTHGGGFYMYTTTASRISQIQTKMRTMLIDVRNYMEINNIPQQGNPFILYNNWDEPNNNAIYSVAVFTPNLVVTPANSTILNGMMPVQRAVKTTLNGDHNNLPEAWEQAYRYIEENNLQINEDSPTFEVYRTLPENTINPANHITELYIPILEGLREE